MAQTVIRLTARIWREDDSFVSFCPELGVASCGDSYDHAREMLQEAVELYLEDMDVEEILNQVHPEAAAFPLDVKIPA
ncbi:type II toxin-antitoxin system HicB family antitoxin [Allonocardiopsis opalescens]|uniref:Putative RNase H-like HicB family nuclease n=1 Tax=Allonocardiopsis opalescens TaxID=1144618 RepID=A0A2T0Q3R1_9ACTN|nr:type II toxin-antitoxin system HicB family antitoxin [Allonocardiopsis opalescens]PRX98444.1 putative RNase H-like HicB family nuclease [Allonocardiopsis opalescens]